MRRPPLLLAVLGVLAVPLAAGAQGPNGPPARARQDAGFPVVVFEGQGLGHGMGLPLDGADALAREGADASDLLDRFYPGAARGSGDGLVRVLLAARDDLREGIDVVLPDGGTVRDGRTTPVAPSFPIRVPAGRTVRLSHSDGFYRAEILDERSVSGTVEITPTGEAATTTAPRPTTAPAPALAASERSLWVEPRQGGELSVAPETGGGARRYAGLTEIVVEAERLHAVVELDVEDYLVGLDLTLPDGAALETAALEAAVIAARSYALRAAATEPRVGRFHLFADGRSLPYAGVAAPAAVARAVRATDGQILTDAGDPIAALSSAHGGGKTAAPAEVYGPDVPDLPYLVAAEYPGDEDFDWRVEMELADAARRLGYAGDATALAVTSVGPSERPTALTVSGSAGDLAVAAPAFHDALRLPSSHFEVRMESRTEPLPDRADSPPFQELPGPIADGDAAGAAVGRDREPAPSSAGDDGSSSNRLPLILVAVAGASLVVAFLVLVVADLQRRVRTAKERRATRRRHPAERPAPAPPRPAPEPEPAPPRPAPEPPVDAPVEPPVEPAPAPWHNEPEWLDDLVPADSDAPPVDAHVDDATLRRETRRLHADLAVPHPDDLLAEDEEPPETRPLSEVLGWDDAPAWIDEPPPPDDRD